MIVGGLFGATVVLLVFSFVMIPPPSIPLPELIVSNGHEPSPSIVGEVTPLPVKKDLLLTEIFERSEEGVVRVNVVKEQEILGINGIGSGFVFDTNGHIITNAHVVENADEITVTFLDGRSYKAKIIGVDRFTDLAVIKVEASPSLLQPLPLGDSSNLKVGMEVVAIGNPFGLSGSMTSGIVSQLGRLLPSQDTGFSIPDVIQTDAAINPGNSGGPLLNLKAEVIGINTAIQSATGEFTGVGFAIPSKTISKIVPDLIDKGEHRHPWVGISGRDIDPNLAEILNLPDARGFLVITIIEGSPADIAGLRGTSETKQVDGKEYAVGGDIILSVDGITVRKIDDILIHLQREKRVGDEMLLEILRDGEKTNIVVKLVERPELS